MSSMLHNASGWIILALIAVAVYGIWRLARMKTASTAPHPSTVIIDVPAGTPTESIVQKVKVAKLPKWVSRKILFILIAVVLVLIGGIWLYHQIPSGPGPICTSAARSGGMKGCYRTPQSAVGRPVTTQASVAKIEAGRHSFCFSGKSAPAWVQIPEGGFDVKYSTVPSDAKVEDQCTYDPAKPGDGTAGAICDPKKNAYWFRTMALSADAGETCVRYRFVLRS